MSKPFENIAISLSGGGYRASAFHLGALSYLDHVSYKDLPLLQSVKVMSTISGGTFTGVSYVLALAQGKDFKSCFHKLYGLLQDDKLVVEALEKINHTQKWQAQGKNKNLINAFSEVYQARFCDEQHLSLLLHKPLGHLNEFCFNATDMYDAIPFRFQKTGKMGNGRIHITHKAAAEIRLGDIMAASSCFPGGFEPMAFPGDFVRDNNSPLQEYWQERKYPANIALMDGGILDNQGIESIEMENDRPNVQKIGTYIISDVSPRNAPPFNIPDGKIAGLLGNLTLRTIQIVHAMIALAALAGIWWFWNTSRLLLIVSVLVALFGALVVLAIWGLQKLIDNLVTDTLDQKSETTVILKNLDILEKTPIKILWNLAITRFFSLSSIMENVFMNRIRVLELKNLYVSKEWDHKLISNNIYSLYTDYKEAKNIPHPSAQMLATAEKAATMPTSLWFSSKEKEAGMLDVLIVAGQITLCFQLLRHLNEEINIAAVKETFSLETQLDLQALEARILADYLRFIEDEKWLLKELIAQGVYV